MITFMLAPTGSFASHSPQTKSSGPTRAHTITERKSSVKTRRLVVKFGGTSLGDKDRISKASRLVAKEISRGTKIAVVVSAMGKTTDHLIGLVNHDTGRTLDKTDLDDVIAMGERTSVRVFAAALKAQGLEAKYFDPSEPDWPIITDDEYSNANPIVELCIQKIREYVVPLLDWGTIPVIAGFVGRSTDGKVTTIGRGGSDTTAFILAKAIGADEVVIVTDSNGILSADPKHVPNARKLDRIDVKTLIGLADSGTKFIHRKALRYKDQEIPVRVINNAKDDLEADGTIITGGISNEIEVGFASDIPSMAVTIAGKGISENPAIISAIAREIRNKSMLHGLSADFDSMIFYVPHKPDNALLNSIHDIVSGHGEAVAMAFQPNLAFLRVKGVGLEETPGMIGRISARLRENGINIFGILTLASSILFWVSWEDKERSLTLMKQVVKGEL